MKLPTLDRLRSKAEPIPFCGCVIFTGAHTPKGYGVIYHNGRQRYAHRVMYELTRGPVPEGKFVLHRCDVPSCINPDHLFIGTAMDNSRDMVKKGRASKYWLGKASPSRGKRIDALSGDGNGMAKLSRSNVAAIRADLSQGLPQTYVAKKYGVHQSHISRIYRRESWS